MEGFFIFSRMELDILDETYEQMDRRLGKRPVFLTVLCILTWVGSGIGLLFGLFRLWSYAAINKMSKEMSQALGEDQNFNSMFGYLFWESIAQLVSALLCSLGAIFMFRMRKFGFFIYLVGQLLPLSVTVLSAMSKDHYMGQEFTIIWTGFSFLFPVAFIVMYGVNLKHMK